MNIATRRLSLATAALLMAAVGAVSLFLNVDGTVAQDEFIIEVNEEGFNPPSCTINKNTTIRWKNVGGAVHRVVRPAPGVDSPPLFDTKDLDPGETSGGIEFALQANFEYEDFYNPELKGKIIVPNARGAQSCDLQPPTPTPTPTPLPTATPDPRRAFIPGVSRGGEPPTPTPTATMTPTPTATPESE